MESAQPGKESENEEDDFDLFGFHAFTLILYRFCGRMDMPELRKNKYKELLP